MISNQILQTTIDGLKGITRIDLCICDTEGNQIIMTREDATIGLDLSEGIDDVQTDTDIITVTGVKYTEDKQDYVYGTEGYMINLKENQLLAGNAEV